MCLSSLNLAYVLPRSGYVARSLCFNLRPSFASKSLSADFRVSRSTCLARLAACCSFSVVLGGGAKGAEGGGVAVGGGVAAETAQRGVERLDILMD